MPLKKREEFKTENWSIDSTAPAFFVRATIKGLELLYGILVTAKKILDVFEDIRDRQSLQGNTINSEEAEKVLGVSKNTLKKLKKDKALVEGIHYRQHEGTLRFHPDLGRLFIEHSGPSNVEEDDNPAEFSTEDKQVARQRTKNFFKEK